MRILHAEIYGIEENPEESEELNLQNKALDNEWLFSQIALGRLTQQAYLNLQIIKDACENMYPGLWDIQIISRKVQVNYLQEMGTDRTGLYFYYEDGDAYRYFEPTENSTAEQTTYIKYYTFRIIVKFPEVTIKNRNGITQHEIKDIYFSFIYGHYNTPISLARDRDHSSRHTLAELNDMDYYLGGYKIKSGLQSARTTVSPEEYEKGYLHSHSHNRRGSGAYTKWDNCCLGEGEINQIFSMLSGYTIDPGHITLLLLQIQTYASWESLEGGPYMYYEQLGQGNRIPEYPRLGLTILNNYFGRLISTYQVDDTKPFPELDWKVVNNLPSLLTNNKFNEFCKIYPTVSDYELNLYGCHNMIFYRNIQGDIFSVGRVGRATPTSDHYLVYRGEKIPLTITDGVEIPMEDGFVVNPNIIQYIKLKLESYANFKKTRDYSIKRASQSSNQ